jgi:hypothetical protein
LAALALNPAVTSALFLAATLAANARGATVEIRAADEAGKVLDRAGLERRLLRADAKEGARLAPPFWAIPLDGKSPRARVSFEQHASSVTATWAGGPARFEFLWPVEGDGYNEVSADNDGHGFSDGAVVLIIEETARTQYRGYRESWKRRTTDWSPAYSPGPRAKELAEDAKDAVADAEKEEKPEARAAAFSKSLTATAASWEKMLFEHGQQTARDDRFSRRQRFGLTLDESILRRLAELDWIARATAESGTGWIRLVFRANPEDFTYASLRSFNEYDAVVAAFAKRGIKIMGGVLDTAQWPATLSPAQYAERVKNIVLHYKDRIGSWEIGSELNGDWFGGASSRLSSDAVFDIYAAGSRAARESEPEAELVATLYHWDSAAPDEAHTLAGWLARYGRRGFTDTADLFGVELFPEDSPVGMSLERDFDLLAEAAPRKKVMLSSFGYVEKDALRGYWWLSPDDVDGARADLVTFYTTASCAMRESLCGGFWWQTLDQMFPPRGPRSSELFKTYRKALSQLGRKQQ